MSRSVKDLRDFICVSRLTIRASDDEVISSDEEFSKPQESGGNIDIQKSSFDHCNLISTPDSGFGTNGHIASDSLDSDNDKMFDIQGGPCSKKISGRLDNDSSNNHIQSNQGKKKTKSRPAQSSDSEKSISKTTCSQLYSTQKAASLLKNELLSVSHCRVDTRAFGERSATPSYDFAEGHFEKLLMYIDGRIVSEWLEQSNKNVAELTAWCHTEDNFIQFAHFWLSEFSDKEKFELLRLENSILLDQLSFAFAVGLNSREIQQRHLSMFLNAVFREYPAKLISSQGPHLFLDYLDILSSSKQLPYRQLLSDVRCSTRTQQHVQWILATRSFALVSVWSSVVNFYKKLRSDEDKDKPSPSFQDIDLGDEIYLQRTLAAIRYGHADVIHYMLKSGKVSPNSCDKQQKSLVFNAVICKQRKILQMLLNQVNFQADGNHAASNGNTPLHAAANGGCKEIVEELLACDKIKVNVCNPQCENATPLHYAILHGHEDIVRLLLLAGANRSMVMGALTAIDVAKVFGQDSILQLLQEDDN